MVTLIFILQRTSDQYIRAFGQILITHQCGSLSREPWINMHMILIKKDSDYRLFTIEIFDSAEKAEDYADRCNSKRKKDDMKVVLYNWHDFRKAAL